MYEIQNIRYTFEQFPHRTDINIKYADWLIYYN